MQVKGIVKSEHSSSNLDMEIVKAKEQHYSKRNKSGRAHDT
jgi:hypothetical protein